MCAAQRARAPTSERWLSSVSPPARSGLGERLASGDGGAARAREPSRYVRVLYNGARVPYTQGAVVARWGAAGRGGARWRAMRVCAMPCYTRAVPCCVRACRHAFHLSTRLTV